MPKTEGQQNNRESFCKRLAGSMESRPDKTAMRIVGDDAHVYTFGETLSQVRSIAWRLGEEKIEFGDCVALIGENHPCWAVAYLGTLYRGAVCVPLDPHGEIDTLTNFIENSQAKLAFIGSEVVKKFEQIQERLGRHIRTVVWEGTSPPRRGDAENADGGDAEARTLVRAKQSTQNNGEENFSASPRLGGSNGFDAFSDWTTAGFPETFARETPKAADNDIALLIYTSGTTGTPKGVPLTHGNILAELDGINEVLKLTDKEKILSLLPLFHAYLQIVNLWVATTYGCEVGYLKELSPAELGNAMKEFKPTILTTVPRLWYLFHKKIFDAVDAKPKAVQALFKTMLAANGVLRDTFGANLGPKLFGQVHESFGGRLRIAISAGSRFDEDVALDFHKLGFTILQGYGLTETSGAATATFETDNRIGSVGKPMKGVSVKLDNPSAEGVGEVLIKGDIVFSGYYQNPQATADAFTADGWFRSGDLGRIDADGHLYIVGRAKDVIVLPSGKNVHPEDLEVHYLKAPEILELAIVGVADKSEARSGAEKLAAVIVPDFEYLKHAKLPNSKEAIRYAMDDLGRSLPEYQRVRDYIVRAEPLPRTGSNKVKRFQLKKDIESGTAADALPETKTWTLTAAGKVLLESAAAQTVIAAIRPHIKEVDEIHPEMNLEIDLGLDSLSRAEVFAALEMRTGKEFNADEVANALTVADVVDLVSTSASSVLSAERTTEHTKEHGTRENLPTSSSNTDNTWSKILLNVTESDIPEVRENLKHRPLFSAFAFVVYKCFNLLCRIFMRLEVEGLENLTTAMSATPGRNASVNERAPRDVTHHTSSVIPEPTEAVQKSAVHTPHSAFLICPNHQSFLDPFVLCSTYPFAVFRNVFHVGASEFFRGRVMGFVAKMLRVVPIDPDTQLMRAMKAGAIGLRQGRVLNIYPEGERAYDGRLHEFKKGAAILATELDLPIVPVALDGLQNVWARQSWRIRPAKVKIRIAKPFYASEVLSVPPAVAGGSPSPVINSTNNADQHYDLVTAHLKQTIADMIEEMRLKTPY